ncbi:ribonuclease H-like domain-containing protein [Tanacetum coccineum]|uniref:Ribonuclease H-like domain-containing protein n=1 Tax=Tanacetum coccineum TaxID=301880 RepID=A0ABQ5E770_9ASTR
MHQKMVLQQNKPKQQQQQLIPTTTTILNIKLPILKKEEYDIWAMEMEHYLEYIDNDVWKLEAYGAEVSMEDANHRFLRSLLPAWSNLAMTMRTKPDVDTLSIDDFTCTPTSSNNIQEREVPAGFADEVIYSLFAKQSEDLDLLHEDLEQIDDIDIEEMDINWQIAMIAIRMKKFYKKTRRRVRIDGNKPVGFDKKKLECFKCHNTGHFARECPSKGTNDGK